MPPPAGTPRQGSAKTAGSTGAPGSARGPKATDSSRGAKAVNPLGGPAKTPKSGRDGPAGKPKKSTDGAKDAAVDPAKAPILPKAGGVDQTEAQNAMLSAEILAALKEAAKAAVEAALQNGLDKKHTGVVQAAALNAAVECLAPGSSETLNLTDDDDQILSLCVHRPCER